MTRRSSSPRSASTSSARPASGSTSAILVGRLRDLHPRPAAERRLHGHRQLRAGRLHGDRRLLGGDPRRRRRRELLPGAAAGDHHHDAGVAAHRPLRRCALRDRLLRDRDDRLRRDHPLHRAERPWAHGRQPGHDLDRIRQRQVLRRRLVHRRAGSVDHGQHPRPHRARRPRLRGPSALPGRLDHLPRAHLRAPFADPATPWGRVLRAVREDEDAARALGKNAFSYKLQSLAIAAGLGALVRLVPGDQPRVGEPGDRSSRSSPSSATRSSSSAGSRASRG